MKVNAVDAELVAKRRHEHALWWGVALAINIMAYRMAVTPRDIDEVVNVESVWMSPPLRSSTVSTLMRRT